MYICVILNVGTGVLYVIYGMGFFHGFVETPLSSDIGSASMHPSYHVILVLVKESDLHYKFCKDHMTEFDMALNHFLQLDFQHDKFEYCSPIGLTMWVELFVVGDVLLKMGYCH